MKTITIDCTQLQSREDMHTALAAALEFPDWYGRNLDALLDCMTSLDEPVRLRFTGWDTLPGFAGAFADVFTDAAAEDPDLTVIYE